VTRDDTMIGVKEKKRRGRAKKPADDPRTRARWLFWGTAKG
jgi:hypothetical protein